jgi:hypothetical protein
MDEEPQKPAALEGGLETPPLTSFYRNLPPGGSPPPKAPEGHGPIPPDCEHNIAEYGAQDEPFLRSTTLKLYRTLHQSGLVTPLGGMPEA